MPGGRPQSAGSGAPRNPLPVRPTLPGQPTGRGIALSSVGKGITESQPREQGEIKQDSVKLKERLRPTRPQSAPHYNVRARLQRTNPAFWHSSRPSSAEDETGRRDLDRLVNEGASLLSNLGPLHTAAITDALQASVSALARTLRLRSVASSLPAEAAVASKIPAEQHVPTQAASHPQAKPSQQVALMLMAQEAGMLVLGADAAAEQSMEQGMERSASNDSGAAGKDGDTLLRDHEAVKHSDVASTSDDDLPLPPRSASSPVGIPCEDVECANAGMHPRPTANSPPLGATSPPFKLVRAESWIGMHQCATCLRTFSSRTLLFRHLSEAHPNDLFPGGPQMSPPKKAIEFGKYPIHGRDVHVGPQQHHQHQPPRRPLSASQGGRAEAHKHGNNPRTHLTRHVLPPADGTANLTPPPPPVLDVSHDAQQGSPPDAASRHAGAGGEELEGKVALGTQDLETQDARVARLPSLETLEDRLLTLLGGDTVLAQPHDDIKRSLCAPTSEGSDVVGRGSDAAERVAHDRTRGEVQVDAAQELAGVAAGSAGPDSNALNAAAGNAPADNATHKAASSRAWTRARVSVAGQVGYKSAFSDQMTPVDCMQWAVLLKKEGVRLFGWDCARNVASVVDATEGSLMTYDPTQPARTGSFASRTPRTSRKRGGRPATGDSQASSQAVPEPDPPSPEEPPVCEVGEWEGEEIVRRRIRQEGERGRRRHSIDPQASCKSSAQISQHLEQIIVKGEHLASALKTFEAQVTAKLMKRINTLEAHIAEMLAEFRRWQVFLFKSACTCVLLRQRSPLPTAPALYCKESACSWPGPCAVWILVQVASFFRGL